MVIEDDRTIGLNGNWEQFDDTPEQSADGNDFYWFFRNVGRSGKRVSDNFSFMTSTESGYFPMLRKVIFIP